MIEAQIASTPALRDIARGTTSGPWIEHVTPVIQEASGGLSSDREFAAMRTAYGATGGIARGDDLARLLEDSQRGDFVSLARLIVSGQVFCLDWHHNSWVPMFQFDLRDLSINQGPRRVRAELGNEFDGWSLGAWFARSNSWLNGRRPVDLLDSNLSAVLEASRADRFIAAG